MVKISKTETEKRRKQTFMYVYVCKCMCEMYIGALSLFFFLDTLISDQQFVTEGNKIS